MLAPETTPVTERGRGAEQAFTQAALPTDANTSFIKDQDTGDRCVRPEVTHRWITMKAATPHTHQSLQCISGMHGEAAPYVRGQGRDEDVQTPHQNRSGTTGKGHRGQPQRKGGGELSGKRDS